MKYLRAFIKKETVLSIAIVLALLSTIFVPPTAAYIDYINYRVLAILLGLMIVMEGLSRMGVFENIAKALIKRVKNTNELSLILVFLCFFFSMIITNDVSLITFVPLALTALRMADAKQLVIPVVTLQTIGANLGSMLTPIGNPQNLYLYDLMGVSLGDFLLLMLPLTIASAILLLIAIFVLAGSKKMPLIRESDETVEEAVKHSPRKVLLIGFYLLLFLLNLLVVADVIPYTFAILFTVFSVFIMDRKTLIKVDYCLLFTFISFFVFVGNMGNISGIANFLTTHLIGHELPAAVAFSQVISNVPAVLLLAGFTNRYHALLYGVDLGGLGTLIASMASLISYKCVAREYQEKKGKYLLYFTVVNVVFLIPLYLLGMILVS